MNSNLQLWQFRVAMYPEAARWILDFKGIEHTRHSLLPGPHVPKMLRRFAYKATPVLRDGDSVIKGVAKIGQHLEQRYPTPSLIPQQHAHDILTLQQQFLAAGPAVRRAFFGALLQDKYAADRFSSGFPQHSRQLYRWAFPATRAIMRKDMGVNQPGIAAGLETTEIMLNLIAQRSAESGYLVGSNFSLADLSAAAIMHVCVIPNEYPADWPTPYPAALQHWVDRWAEHPGAAWIKRMYQQHRGASSACEDINV